MSLQSKYKIHAKEEIWSSSLNILFMKSANALDANFTHVF